MKIKVILNPYANRWNAKARLDEINQAFANVGLSPDIALTTMPGEGRVLAETAVSDKYEAIIAAGGDGTINEIINGILSQTDDGPTIPFGILPIGTANDLADMVNMPRDLTEVAKLVANGQTRQIDVGQINDHYFDNNCALGMEPLVTLEHTKIKRVKGNLRYFLALVKAIAKLEAWHYQVEWDNGSFDGPALMLSVCNSPRTGGLFFIAPEAKVDDGFLDFVLAPKMSKAKVLTLLPKLFSGKHVEDENVIYERATYITVSSEPGTPIHADGELIAPSIKQANYKILPGKITLFAPVGE